MIDKTRRGILKAALIVPVIPLLAKIPAQAVAVDEITIYGGGRGGGKVFRNYAEQYREEMITQIGYFTNPRLIQAAKHHT